MTEYIDQFKGIRGVFRSGLLCKALQTGLLMCVIGSTQAQLSTFNTSTNVLTLDTIAVGGQYYSGVGLNFQPGQPWSIVGNPRLISPLASIDAASYSYTDGRLNLPRTRIGNAIYDNYILSMPVGGNVTVLSKGMASSASSPGYQEVAFPIRSKIKNSAETDANGELTYALTNGQVWKHMIDEPCMPPGIGTDDPDGYSDVEIYPNPGSSGSTAANEGNFRFVTYYPSKDEALKVETCIVVPVAGVFGVAQSSGLNALAVSTAAISGNSGARYNLSISGGLPPYTVVASPVGVVDFWFQSVTDLTIQMVNSGSATLTVFDYNRSSQPVTIQVAQGATMYPSGIDGFTEGTSLELTMYFGSPPYAFDNPFHPYVQVEPIGDANTTHKFRLTLASLPAGSELKEGGVLFKDAYGSMAQFSIKNFKENTTTKEMAVVPSSLTLFPGMTMNISIAGGRPPYACQSPLPGTLEVGPVSSSVFSVKATGYLTSSVPIFCSDVKGNYATVTVIPYGSSGSGGYTNY